MKVDLLTSREELEAVSWRWDELARLDTRDGFFRTSGWYRAWIEHIRPDAQPFVLLVRDATGNIVGLPGAYTARAVNCDGALTPEAASNHENSG